jgi:hypothetical protein
MTMESVMKGEAPDETFEIGIHITRLEWMEK